MTGASSTARRVAPWALGALAFGGIAALAWRSGGAADPLGPVMALAAAPLMTLWFACVAILARRILQLRDPHPVRLARVGPVALSGAVLVAPLAFVRLEEPAALPVLALFLAGTTLLFLSGARLVLGGRRIAFRPLTASLSVLIFVAPPDVLPLKLGVLPALLGSFAAVSLRYLTRAEDRFPRRVWWLRAAAVLCGVAMMLPLGVAISASGSVQGAVELLGPLAAICAVLFMAGLLLGYTTLAFAASDLIGTVTRSFRSVRTRMVVLGTIAAAVGFALRGLEWKFHLGEVAAARRYQPIVDGAFSLAVICLFVWIFAVAMARRLARSLELSVAALAAIREGDLSITLPETGDDELSEVARTFNAMVAQLREVEFLERINAGLQTRSADLQRALESFRTAQAELVRAERMASVATLVRGIAHELNNPIGFIAGNAPVLQRYCDFLARAAGALSDGKPRSAEELRTLTELSPRKDLRFVIEDVSRMTSDIAEGARRARLIISDLQNLTMGSERALEEVDLHRIVRQSLSLLAPRLGPSLRVETELEPVPRLAARAGQLEQVMVNLLDNAIRAVGSPGTIHVRVRRLGADVAVSVEDDGSGMTEEVRRQACEPFFTTRTAGDGSGLGLAIVASIVRGHRGTLEIRSAPAKGTEITIRIPVTPDAAALA